MLEHLNPTPQKPSRVVVLGAYGFVGGTCSRRLAARGVPVLPLDKDDIDLTASGAAGQEIVLFGEGEERRDHVLVDDVAEIVCRVIEHRSRGTLNIATGDVYSFRDIAERIAAMAKPVVAVRGTPRQGEMPHGGYRPFDIAACRRAFPDFRYTSLADGLKQA